MFYRSGFSRYHGFEAIFHRVKDQCDLVWLENLNLRGGFKKDILALFRRNTLTSCRCTTPIYTRGDRGYFRELEERAERLAREYDCPFVDNELPYGGQSRGIRSSWITFITRKCAARRTPASGIGEPPWRKVNPLTPKGVHLYHN